MVIFTTASSEYALISYELQAIDYLLKPFAVNRFEPALTYLSTNYAGYTLVQAEQGTDSSGATYYEVHLQ